MTDHDTLEVTSFHGDVNYLLERLWDAIDNSSDQNKITILTDDRQPVAAIVPLDVVEYYDEKISNLSKMQR